MENEEISKELEALHETVCDKFAELEKKLDTKKIHSLLNDIEKKLEFFKRNSAKFDTMVKELNGAICFSRALFKDQKNKTPVWYKISEINPKDHGEIWIKDIHGTETLARCEGLAIIYPASSSLKAPEFWKPV